MLSQFKLWVRRSLIIVPGDMKGLDSLLLRAYLVSLPVATLAATRRSTGSSDNQRQQNQLNLLPPLLSASLTAQAVYEA